MIDSEKPPPDKDISALPSTIAEISRAIDTLRGALEVLGEGPSGSRVAPPGPGGGAAPGSMVAEVDAALGGLAGDEDPIHACGPVFDRLLPLLDADRGMLLLDDGQGTLIPAAARGFRRDDPGTIAIAAGDGLIGRARVEGRIQLTADPGGSFPDDAFLARFPVRSAVAVPVRSGGVVVGVLYAGARWRERPFSAEQALSLLAMADRIGAALAHRRLASRAGLHFERLRLLRAFTAETAVGRDLAATLARACEIATRLLDASAAAVVMMDAGGGLTLRAACGLPDTLAPGSRLAGEGAEVIRHALESAAPVSCGGPGGQSGPEAAFLLDAGFPSCLAVALRPREAVAGVLYVADARARAFALEEIEVAQLLGSLLGLAMENERLYGETRVAFEALTSAQERLVQSETVRALGSMAGGVAHEFNNILAIILGKTQLLLARPQDEKTRESLGHVEEAAWRAADIVRRLQGFAAPAAGEATGLLDLRAVVEDVITLTRGVWKDEAEARGVRIDVATDLEDTPLLPGNAAEIREALTNLVLNAVDAMARGGRLRVAVRSEADGATVLIEDSGEGMPEHVRRLAFEPFFSTRSPLRTGLGLSVVHGVVARHRGRVDIASQPGRGTRVTVWLPASSAPAPEHTGTAGRATAPDAGPGTVLIIEAEPTIRAILVDAASEAGHRVEAVADGASGLTQVQRGRFDVVVADLSLPERSGLEVARAVKSLRPRTPVVLITGWGDLLAPETLRDNGVDLTLVKPFRLERVRAVLDDALRLSRHP